MNMRFPILILPVLAGVLIADDPLTRSAAGAPAEAEAEPESAFGSTPRLGITLARPVSGVRAQLPGLPKGSGFVLEKVEAGGPAAEAGLIPHDVIWRMSGQLLINEAQLLVLLSQHRPGDEVEIDFFRLGKGGTVKLTLGHPSSDGSFEMIRPGQPLVTGAAVPGMPVRVVNVPSRTATMDNEDGRAELTLDRTGIHVVISDTQGRTVHEGPLFDPQGQITVPVEWRERVESLHGALIESIQRARPVRQPRLRVIPIPAKESDR
jgi:hypothetical protein